MRDHGIIARASRQLLVWCGIAAPALCVPVCTLVAQGAVSGRVTLLEKPGQKTTDLDNAVVWLEPASQSAPRPRATKVELAMRARQFAPHVRAVPLGSTVEFPNQDAFGHNVFSSVPGSAFDLRLYGRGQKGTYAFAKPGAISVYCNVHTRMSAVVVVVPTPWYAQAGADGRWKIPAVPAGAYTLHVWHERGVQQTLPVTVAASDGDVAPVQLDARGYTLVQHKDKFGKDYTGPGQIRY